MSKPSADFERIAKQEFQTKVESSAQIAKNLRRQSLLHRFILDQATLLRHLLIVESTGSGKTNHTFRLIKMASEEAEQSGCVVVDVKREYRALTSLLPGRVRVVSIGGEPKGHLNPLAPPKGWTLSTGTERSRMSSLAPTASRSRREGYSSTRSSA